MSLEKMARPERFERPTLRFVGSRGRLILLNFPANRGLRAPLKVHAFLERLQTA
jgi:hypothetical protein